MEYPHVCWQHFVLIEFNSLSDVNSVSSAFTHTNIHQNLPVISPMLWFRATNDRKKGPFPTDIPMTVTNGKAFPSLQTVNDWLYSAETVSETVFHPEDTFRGMKIDISPICVMKSTSKFSFTFLLLYYRCLTKWGYCAIRRSWTTPTRD